MKTNKISFEATFTVLTGLMLGYLIVMQAYSVEDINGIVARDRTTNIFREIQILNEKNSELEQEIVDLENTLEQYSDRASYLQAIEDEIVRYEKIAGEVPVSGPGVKLVVKTSEGIDELWFVDIVNELINSGAEAVSVQGIRIVDETNGFDVLPSGQIFLNGIELISPYEFNAVGPSNEISDSLEQANGVVERLLNNNPGVQIEVRSNELIEIPAAG